MLQRIFLLTLVVAVLGSALGQEELQSEPDLSKTENQDERPRGERAEPGDLPPPRRQRQSCQLNQILNLLP